MTRKEAQELLPIIQAWAEGKSIQYQTDSKSWSDITKDLYPCNHPSLYRIKPEQKYRPFNSKEECWQEMQKHPNFGWIMNNSKDYLNITEIFLDGINFPPYDIGEGHSMPENYSFNKSFSHFTFTDGAPFGIKEE